MSKTNVLFGTIAWVGVGQALLWLLFRGQDIPTVIVDDVLFPTALMIVMMLVVLLGLSHKKHDELAEGVGLPVRVSLRIGLALVGALAGVAVVMVVWGVPPSHQAGMPAWVIHVLLCWVSVMLGAASYLVLSIMPSSTGR